MTKATPLIPGGHSAGDRKHQSTCSVLKAPINEIQQKRGMRLLGGLRPGEVYGAMGRDGWRSVRWEEE